jgi:predicted ATP-grasp superfamily ATP-dependent carboligase
MPDAPFVLIAAASGRALANSARRAGYAPLVVDFFGDQDTVAAAAGHQQLRPDDRFGMDPDALLVALETLAAGRAPCGVVWGTGFEDRPSLLARIAERWVLLGNRPESVARVKNPAALAELCRCCDISHPAISLLPPEKKEGWLAKRIGGAGGTHIRPDNAHAVDGFYYQRQMQGTPVSALILADGQSAVILGFSTQWSSPAPGRPFRYGGAARPAALRRETADGIVAAVRRLVASMPLVGLNSIDFLVDGAAFHLLEVNPRPGATFDIFEPQRGRPLFELHVASCQGALPAAPVACDGAAASAIVYADHDIPLIPSWNWPPWTADRPIAGSCISAQCPLCTVIAAAATAAQARELVDQRARSILARLRASPP